MRSALLIALFSLQALPVWAAEPFLAQKRFVLSGQDWSREITSQGAGSARCKVTGPGRLGITVIADRSYQAMNANDRSGFKREDVLLSIDALKTHEQVIRFPSAGSYWFIIQNQSSEPGELSLRCSVSS